MNWGISTGAESKKMKINKNKLIIIILIIMELKSETIKKWWPGKDKGQLG